MTNVLTDGATGTPLAGATVVARPWPSGATAFGEDHNEVRPVRAVTDETGTWTLTLPRTDRITPTGTWFYQITEWWASSDPDVPIYFNLYYVQIAGDGPFTADEVWVNNTGAGAVVGGGPPAVPGINQITGTANEIAVTNGLGPFTNLALFDPVIKSVIAAGKPWLDIRKYVHADLKILTDVQVTAGSAVIYSPSGPFVPADAAVSTRKTFVLPQCGDWDNAGDHTLGRRAVTAQIIGYTDAQHVTIATNALTTTTGVHAWYGTDDTANFALCVASGFNYLRMPETGKMLCGAVSAGWLNVVLVECEGEFYVCQRDEVNSASAGGTDNSIWQSTDPLQGITIRGRIKFRMIDAPRVISGNSAISFYSNVHGSAGGATNHDQLNVHISQTYCYGAQYDPWIVAQCRNALIYRTEVESCTEGITLAACSYSDVVENYTHDMTNVVIDQICYQIAQWSSLIGSQGHADFNRSIGNRAVNCTNFCGILHHDGRWFWSINDMFLSTCAGISETPVNTVTTIASDMIVDYVFTWGFTWLGATDPSVTGNSQYQGWELWGEPANVNGHGSLNAPVTYAEVDGARFFQANSGSHQFPNGSEAGYQQGAILFQGYVTQCVLRNVLIGDGQGYAVFLYDTYGTYDIRIDGLDIYNQQNYLGYNGLGTPSGGFITIYPNHSTAPTGRFDNCRLQAKAGTSTTLTAGLFWAFNVGGISIGANVRMRGTITRDMYLVGVGTAPVQDEVGWIARTPGTPAAPTVNTGGLGTGGTAVVAAGGTDREGILTCVGGTGAAAGNRWFAFTGGISLRAGTLLGVAITPINANASALGTYSVQNIGGGGGNNQWQLFSSVAPANATTYTFAYRVYAAEPQV